MRTGRPSSSSTCRTAARVAMSGKPHAVMSKLGSLAVKPSSMRRRKTDSFSTTSTQRARLGAKRSSVISWGSPGIGKTKSSSASDCCEWLGRSSVTEPVMKPRGDAMMPSAERGQRQPSQPSLIIAHTSSTRLLTSSGLSKRFLPVLIITSLLGLRRYHSSR